VVSKAPTTYASLLPCGSPLLTSIEISRVLHTLVQGHFKCAPMHSAHCGVDQSASLAHLSLKHWHYTPSLISTEPGFIAFALQI